jgi:hypothetical protein
MNRVSSEDRNLPFQTFPQCHVHTDIKKNIFFFNAAIADVLVYTNSVPVQLLSVADFIFQQHIAIYNKCTSVPLTDAQLQTVHVQPQFCDHTLNNEQSTQFFQNFNNIFSSGKELTFILPGFVLKYLQRLHKKVIIEQEMIKSQKKYHFLKIKTILCGMP